MTNRCPSHVHTLKTTVLTRRIECEFYALPVVQFEWIALVRRIMWIKEAA